MTHILKTRPGEFGAVASGEKTHHVRPSDRPFAAGDTVILREWIPTGTEDLTIGRFTNRAIAREITHVTPAGAWGLPPGICVFSTRPLPKSHALSSISSWPPR